MDLNDFQQLLEYRRDTGDFIWKSRPNNNRWNTRWAGVRAGGVDNLGYVTILGHGAHRLVWLFEHGEWPIGMIDHRDGDPSNNCIGNLRIANRSQNRLNSKGGSTTGVHRYSVNKWRAKLTVNGSKVFGEPRQTLIAAFVDRLILEQEHLTEFRPRR